MSSTIFFFLFIPLLTFILLTVNLIFAPHNPYLEKNSPFECGFSSFLGQNRTQFSISFFIFALLFLLFDLEILLVYPYLVSAYTNGVYGLAILLMFLLALTLGFAFELGKKALSIDSRQMSSVSTNNISYNISKVKSITGLSLNSSKRYYSSSGNIAIIETDINFDIILYLLFRYVILVTSCFLVLALFLEVISYIFDLISFMPYINRALLLSVSIISSTAPFYKKYKKANVTSKIIIKSDSVSHCLADFIINIGLFISDLITQVLRFLILITPSPVIALASYIKGALFSLVEDALFSLLKKTTLYVIFENNFLTKGLQYCLEEWGRFIYNETRLHIVPNIHWVVCLQFLCHHLYHSTGCDYILVISILPILIHIFYFIVSIITHITIIEKDYYQRNPILFLVCLLACLFLLHIFILLFSKLCLIVIPGLIALFKLLIPTGLPGPPNTGGTGGSGGQPGGGPPSPPGPQGPNGYDLAFPQRVEEDEYDPNAQRRGGYDFPQPQRQDGYDLAYPQRPGRYDLGTPQPQGQQGQGQQGQGQQGQGQGQQGQGQQGQGQGQQGQGQQGQGG
uniref:NADH-ubiquinone oxidoreductase chain 3 n=1 Tax=Bryoria tenuis TaxID=1089818 RepID=A0A1Y9TL60_9LECA|nr:NADH dehydrogenase subunit 3 [Bryoria tenuis]ARO90300.1 NADH dehydrogenase subunit 3 [Bryoria tenuis]